MQVSVENTSLLGRRLSVEVPAEQVQSRIREKTAEMLRGFRMPGFRTGMVPEAIFLRQNENAKKIKQDVVSALIESSLPLALQQHALKPASAPTVEKIVHDGDTDLHYVVNFEVFPEFVLADFAQIEIERYHVDIAEHDVDKALQRLQDQFADWMLVERPARLGDRVTIDYVSTIAGKPYENGNGNDVFVELGSRAFIEGFENGFVGAVSNEERVLDLTFPAEWHLDTLAGKAVHFIVQVKAVCEKKIAELDAVFAKKIGAASSDITAIREKVRQSLEKNIQNTIEVRTKEQIIEQLLKTNPIALPQALVDQEVSSLHEDLHRRLGDKAIDSCQHHGLEEDARKRVALSLILNEIIKLEKLSPDEGRVRDKVAELAKMFGNAELMESMYYESQELLAGVQNTILVEQVMEFVLTKVAIVEKTVTVETLLGLGS